MKSSPYLSALSLLIFISCTTSESKSARSEAVKSADTTAQITPAAPEVEATPADDEINERGLLKEVEDGGYPFATLTIEFPERKFTEQFIINLGNVTTVTMDDLNKAIGSYVSFGYTSEISNALLDIQLDGESLLGDDAPTLAADTKQIMGKLKGANRETTGDEPGKIAITTDDNTTETFQYFVTKEMVAANGKVVIGYFEERTRNTIKSIKVLPK
jgi:hypothetical protein